MSKAQNIINNCVINNDNFIMAEFCLTRDSFFMIMKWPIVMWIKSPFMLLYIIYRILLHDHDNNTSINKFIQIILTIITLPLWIMIFIHDGMVSCVRSYNVNHLFNLFVFYFLSKSVVVVKLVLRVN